MWPSTLYPEKTYRFLKNVYDSYGRKKTMGLDQQTQSSSGSSTPLGHAKLAHPRHSLPSPNSTAFSSSSSETPSTPSSSILLGRSSGHSHKQPTQMTRLFHYSKSVAHDVKHKFSLSRLPKIESTDSDSSGKEMPPTSGALSPQAGGPFRQHPPLYYRASSPVFEQRLMYAASARLHHSEPMSMARVTSAESLPPVCGDFLPTALAACQRTSQSVSPGKVPAGQQQQHFFASPADALSRRHSPQSGGQQQRRLSYRSYENNVDSGTVAEARDGARTVLLDKFASDSDVHNRQIGGLTLCGGLEVGLPSIYISRVAANSAADKCGLSAGDQILSANYISFLDGITCKRAYEILDGNGSQSVLLTVLPRREAFAPRQRRHHCYAWIDPDGRAVSPPPPDRDRGHVEDVIGPTEESVGESESHLFSRFRRAPRLRDLHRAGSPSTLNPFSSPPFKRKASIAGEFRQVTITLEKGIDLGLMIRGGIEYGLGIYVTRVDPNSLADQANLRVGDQILAVNEFDFSELLHDEAVDILKSAARLNMKVAYVGKVPSSTYSPMDPSAGSWSPRHSPHQRYYTSSSSSSGVGGEMQHYALSTSPSNARKGPGSPRLTRQSPHHRLTPLSHSNSSPTSTSARHHHHEALHQSHSYREQCISPHYSRAKEHTHGSPFDKRDTPTLLITDSDNRNLPAGGCQMDDDEEEDNDLYVLTVDRAYGNSYRLRKRLQNTKSEEDEATLDEEAMKYLNEKERLTLAYYRNEYETKAMTIDTLVALLGELLDTNEKYSVIFRMYHVIRPEDVDRFDELVYNREEHRVIKSKAMVESKYAHFFKQESSESAGSFECPSAAETGSSGFEALSALPGAGPGGLRMRSEPVTGVASAAPEYDTRLNLSSPLDDGRYHLELHEGAMQSNNRLQSRRESMLMRSSGSVQKAPSPNSVAYRKTFMTRRHSSGTSDTPIVRDISPHLSAKQSLSAFGSYPLVADERRWSIANTECRRPSTLLNQLDLNRRRSPSPSVTFQCADQRSREDLEVPSQRILSRKGSNSSCCQETIPEQEDTACHLAPASPTSTLASASGALRGSGNHLHVPALNGGSDTEDSLAGQFPSHQRVRRHRSLPSPTFTTEKLLASNFPQHQRSNSFRLPSHRAVSEPNGRWRIKVKKSKPMLGIAIEGGGNVTTQTQPRIISIHQSGAAIECGDLHVGHIILEVDGQSTAELNHEQVAQMISRAYYNTPHKDYIEFLVREKSRAEFDLRRSSFMLLNNSFE